MKVQITYTEKRHFKCSVEIEAKSIEDAENKFCSEYFDPYNEEEIDDNTASNSTKIIEMKEVP